MKDELERLFICERIFEAGVKSDGFFESFPSKGFVIFLIQLLKMLSGAGVDEPVKGQQKGGAPYNTTC